MMAFLDALGCLGSILESQSLRKSLSFWDIASDSQEISWNSINTIKMRDAKIRFVDLQKCQEWTLPSLPNSYCAVEAEFALKCFLPWVQICENILESECCWNLLSFNWSGWFFFVDFFLSLMCWTAVRKTNLALIQILYEIGHNFSRD